MKRLLLGFDVIADPVLATWVDERTTTREFFFLNPEVRWPVSVDRVTCPSIFQPAFHAAGGSKTVMTQFPKKPSPSLSDQQVSSAITRHDVDWPELAINILGLWSDLHEMLRWMGERQGLKNLARFAIGIQVNLDATTSSDPLWQTVSSSATRPALASPEWLRLGFDVADRDQTSALSGLEYTPQEMQQARDRWGIDVNASGLLGRLESARAFKAFSDARVPEIAPFYVYEIFKIEPNK
jgi:hypothetical protein